MLKSINLKKKEKKSMLHFMAVPVITVNSNSVPGIVGGFGVCTFE